MKVTHHHNEHLLCLSSEEVALLVDLCHAGAFSDELIQDQTTRRQLARLLGEIQQSLHETAQEVWQRQRLAAGAGLEATAGAATGRESGARAESG